MGVSFAANPVETPSWAAIAGPLEERIAHATSEAAHSVGASERDLRKSLLLHLPRFSLNMLEDGRTIRAEAERLADRLHSRRMPYRDWERQPKVERLERASLLFAPCAPETARPIHERFHYIGAFHEGRHLGVFHEREPEIPMAMVTLSPMDIRNLSALFPTADDRQRCLVLSRLFAFDWAPRNTISFLLGQTCRWLAREAPEVDSLLTYLNPNLGFTGASYEASNWSPFMESPTRYAYLGDDYVTFRACLAMPPAQLRAVRYTPYTLEPLQLLRYGLRRESRARRASAAPGLTCSLG